MTTARSPRLVPLVLLLVATLGWSLPPVFIKYLRNAYDPYTQACLRYGVGAGALLIVSLVALPAELRKAFARSKNIGALALVVIGQQVCWTVACYGAVPTVAQLTTKLSTVIVIFLSFILFHEERSVIKSPIYLVGTGLSILGGAAVLMPRGLSVPVLDRYSILLISVAFLWSVYVVWAKRLVTDLHPVAMFTVLALYTTVGLALVSLTFGQPARMFAASARITIILIISGLIPIATAHPCYHYAQKYLGAALCSSFNLLNPFTTYLFAVLVFSQEHLSSMQWLGAAILLGGTLLVTGSGRRRPGPAAPPDTQPE